MGRTATAPTFAAGTVRALLDAFARLGHDVPALVKAAGLRPDDIGDPDARVSCDAVGALYGAAQRRRPLSNLGLRLAQATPLGAYPLLDYLIVTSATIGEGLRRYARHVHLTGAPLRVEIHDHETPVRVVLEVGPRSGRFPLSLAIVPLRREAAGDLRPEVVCLGDPVDDPAPFTEAFGRPLQSPAPWTGFTLSRAAWELPFRRRDPILHELLERHAAEVLAR